MYRQLIPTVLINTEINNILNLNNDFQNQNRANNNSLNQNKADKK